MPPLPTRLTAFLPALLLALLLLAMPLSPAQARGMAKLPALRPVAACESLTTADMAAITGVSGRIESAQLVGGAAGARPYCRVLGRLDPAIRFEVRLPTEGWTQRYLQTGCGGLCGMLGIRPEKTLGCLPLTNGEIALASTDMGHQGMDAAGWGADPQKRADFAHRGVHLTTLAAKGLIRAFYGRSARYAYFAGCSDGGREALIAAQRYPGDFDGIGAGAPALHFSTQNSMHHTWLAQANTGADGQALVTPADLAVLHKAVMAACDGLDGLEDGQIDDPRQCRFDPASLQCAGDYQAGTCLSAAQVAAVRRFYSGARADDGTLLEAGGLMPGSELEWAGVFVPRQPGGPIFSAMIAMGSINHLMFSPDPDPPYTVGTWPFARAMLTLLEPARALYDADDPDLSRFAARGGKLILWHGWSDPHITPLGTIAYHEAIGRQMGSRRRAAFERLFVLPGMGHCSGGDGPSDFPLLAALMDWVEGGQAPQVLVAQRVAAKAGPPPGAGGPVAGGLTAAAQASAAQVRDLPARSRPVYAWPGRAVYRGTGSLDEAASFRRAE